MIVSAIRLFLFRFLPRRLVPFLTLVEFLLVARRLIRRRAERIEPRRLVTVQPPPTTRS
jgi:hypothetical protein